MDTVFLARADAVDVQLSMKSFCESKMADALNDHKYATIQPFCHNVNTSDLRQSTNADQTPLNSVTKSNKLFNGPRFLFVDCISVFDRRLSGVGNIL